MGSKIIKILQLLSSSVKTIYSVSKSVLFRHFSQNHLFGLYICFIPPLSKRITKTSKELITHT